MKSIDKKFQCATILAISTPWCTGKAPGPLTFTMKNAPEHFLAAHFC